MKGQAQKVRILVDVNTKAKNLVREWRLFHFQERSRDIKEENREMEE